nr:uncharacterized protein LOC129272527 [Lytechinus pictus]
MDRHGNASFWLRGINMGVAFQGLDLSKGWYPACSISTDQHVRFNFGKSKFRYSDVIPDGYIPFCQAHQGPSFPDEYNIFPDIKPLSQMNLPERSNLQKRLNHQEWSNLQEPQTFGDAVSEDYTNDMVASDFGYPEMGGEAFFWG